MTLEQERNALRNKLESTEFNTTAIFAHESEAPPLDMKILHKRRVHTDYYNYEEWKIEYTVESPESISIPAGQKVSAYLLIPWRQKAKVPFPAMICFHQCNVDCPLGKEAVVGKASYRPDQAYGLELVTEGFVVLAPDSINCGERFIPAIREEGEGKQCGGIINNALGRNSWHKHHLDDIRAVDLLCSLDFVDSERIGSIGHSMGSVDARDVMLYDSRVKACILSSLQPNDFIGLHSPRLHIGFNGALDGSPEYLKQIEASYKKAMKFYEADGVPDNLVLRFHKSGHHFLDEFKWEAYARLRTYFAMDEGKQPIALLRLIRDIHNHHAQKRKEEALAIQMPKQTTIIAEEKRLIAAFNNFLQYLYSKKRRNSLEIKVQEDQNTVSLIYRITSETPLEVAATRVPFENYLRYAYQLFFGAGATMQEAISSDALEYMINLTKA